MSHIVTIEVEIRDETAVRAACRRLSLPEPVHGKHRLFSGEVAGLAVELPNWRYPVVCDLATGETRYDNYEGRWGDQAHLDAFLQRYSVENAVLRLANEVKKTIRKVNALDKIAIPDLKQTVHYIQSRLEENERDMFVLMKMVKQNLEKKRSKTTEINPATRRSFIVRNNITGQLIISSP